MRTAALGRRFDADLLDHKVLVLKALAHPVRLGIVVLLSRRPVHVSDLAEALDVPAAIVSQQLRFLRMTGLVAAQRENGWATYRLVEPLLVDMVECVGRCGTRSARAKGARR